MTRALYATTLAIALAVSCQAAIAETAEELVARADAKYCTPKMLANPKESARCHEAAARALHKQAQDALAKATAASSALDEDIASHRRVAEAYGKSNAAGRQQEIKEQALGWHKPYVTCRTSTIGGTTFTNCD
jgi:hypothetical protein